MRFLCDLLELAWLASAAIGAMLLASGVVDAIR